MVAFRYGICLSVQLNISRVSATNEVDIKLNTKRGITYLRTPIICFSLVRTFKISRCLFHFRSNRSIYFPACNCVYGADKAMAAAQYY